MRTQVICLALSIVLLCPYAFAQWMQLGLPNRGIGEIAVGNSQLFAVTTDSGCVFRSTDGGATWVQIIPSLGRDIAIAPNRTTLLVMADSLYRSTDDGDSWTNLLLPQTTVPGSSNRQRIECVALGPNGWIFLGQFFSLWFGSKYEGGHYEGAMSTDNGVSWNVSAGGGLSYSFRDSLVVSCGGAWGPYGGHPGYVELSTDGGHTWETRCEWWAPPGPIVCCSNANLMVYGQVGAGDGGVYVSNDTSATWSRISSLVPAALLALSQGGVLVGTDTTGIYLFTDNGDSLGTINEGLTNLHIHALALDNSGYVYAGTNTGVWRRPMSQIASVREPLTNIPASFTLEQNYPNPFNPRTTIKYELPNSSVVRLSVYDILGREVSVLVNERMDAGVHEVKFDAAGLSSGVYLYRLQAGDFRQTKRLLLLK